MIVLANVVWPALYLSVRYYSWWAIGLGLLIETGVIWRFTRRAFLKCLLIAAAANLVSAILGVSAFGWLGLGWEYFLSYTVYRLLDVGTFNPFGWGATMLMAAGFSFLIEWAVIRFVFRVPRVNGFYLAFFIANLVTAAIALATLFIAPLEL